MVKRSTHNRLSESSILSQPTTTLIGKGFLEFAYSFAKGTVEQPFVSSHLPANRSHVFVRQLVNCLTGNPVIMFITSTFESILLC